MTLLVAGLALHAQRAFAMPLPPCLAKALGADMLGRIVGLMHAQTHRASKGAPN